MTLSSLLRKPSAFVPLAMSFVALSMVIAVVSTVGITRPPDERAPARIFQLLMVLQAPVSTFFAVKWLPSNPRPALVVLFMQAGAAFLAIGTVILLER